MDRIAIFAYSKRGMALAAEAAGHFPNSQIVLCAAPRIAAEPLPERMPVFHPESPSGEYSVEEAFSRANALVFIGALGIAVRKIAPFVRDKRCDPAVLCIDELGNYVIPVLSGHIGGANAMARFLAEKLGGIAVVTTATDINGRFSVDTWASTHGLVISDMKAARVISAAILERDVILQSDFPVATEFPNGCRPEETQNCRPDETLAGSGAGILISYEIRNPFAVTLRLIPKVLHIGIGCRKGTGREQIRDAVQRIFEEHGLDCRAVREVHSVDLKAKEPGLVEYCRDMGWPFRVYTPRELMQVPGEFASSAFVQKTTGADNICERSAMIRADRLIVRKTAINGVTVAVAAENYEVRF